MKKAVLLFLLSFYSIAGYSQLNLEGFESTTGPEPSPSTNWSLGTGDWAVFQNSNGTNVRWNTISDITDPVVVYAGSNAAYMTRDTQNIGQGNSSEDYLVTPAVNIPINAELHFYTRSFTSGNSGTTTYQIKIAPANGLFDRLDPNSYTLVEQWDENQLTTVFNQYQEKTVNLSSYYNLGTDWYVAFVMVNTQTGASPNSDRWLVDNVSINSACLAPTGLTFSAVTQNSASLNWTDPNGATSWQVEVIPAAGTPTGTGITYSGPLPYIITGLLPNTEYKFYVRAICSTGFFSPWAGPSSNFTTQTAPPICGGNYVDTGGTTGNYSNNANVSTTICPINTGDLVTVSFTSFNIENGFDFLRVYNGSDTSGLLLGTFTGNAIPPSITSSAANGCLTFVFTSNNNTTASGWASNVTCAPAPTCSKPILVSNGSVLASTAIISWTQPANPDTSVATQWHILALPCGSPAPTATSTGYVTSSTNPYTLTGLSPTTCYDIYVRSVCSATENSAWSTPTSFTTQAAPPVCGGNFVDSGGVSGEYSDNENITTTICPTTTGELVTVTFTAFGMESCCDDLQIFDGDSASAPLLGTFTGSTLPPTFTSSAANGCLTFVFTSDSSVTDIGWLANVTCAPAPTCRKPVSISNNTVTATSAIISWTQPANPDLSTANQWQILTLPCGSPAPTATSTGFITVSTNPYILTGLSSSTCYDVYIRAVCSATDSSAWSSATTFTTQALPPVCGGNFVDSGGVGGEYSDNENITTTICPTNPGELVTITFTAFGMESCCDSLSIYDGNDTSGTLLGTFTGITLPPSFTSSAANGCLTFVFESDSSVTDIGWLANVTCAPAPTCSRPLSITNGTITYNSAVISWNQPSNPDTSIATQWQVLALPCGSPAPTPTSTGFINVSSNPFTLTGLTSNTCYDVYVRAVCSATDSSAWSTETTFTTQVAPPVCGGSFLDPGINNNYVNNSNIATLICPTNPTDKVTITFTSFNTEASNDVLSIYNGNSTAAPLIGTYSGSILPPTITSSATNGCLYFVFISNGSITQSGWSSNITCSPAASCPSPLGLAASTVITSTSELTWIEAGSATSWQLLSLPCGSPFPTADATDFITITTNPYTINNLNPECCKQFYLRSVCSGTETSDWARAYQNSSGDYVIWNPANGADSVTGTYSGGTVTVTQTGTGNAVEFQSPAGFDANLVVTGANTFSTFGPTTNPPSRSLTFTFSTPVVIDTYSMADVDLGGSWNDTFNFGGVTFTSSSATNMIATNTGAIATSDTDGNGEYASWFGSTTPVTSFSIDFATTDGLTHAYLAYALKVFAPCLSCSRPINVTNSAVTIDSAVISWTQPVNPDGTTASQWELIALPCGSPVPTVTSTGFISVSTNPYTLTGLTSGTCYDVYVRAVCTATDTSSWSNVTTFTTPIAPPVCGGNFIDSGGVTGEYDDNENITTTICPTNPTDLVTVTFTAFGMESCCDSLSIYDGNSTSGELLGTFTGFTLPPSFTSSAANGCLTFVFESDSSVTELGWLANITCAPAPSCRKPVDVTYSTLTYNSAIISWTQPANPDGSTASQWELIALPCGSPAPTPTTTGFISVSTNPYTLNGLMPNTCYDVYVRAVCSPTDSSVWSINTTFTTPLAPPICGGNFLDPGQLGDYSNNSNVATLICPTVSTEKVTVTFTSFDTELGNDILYVYNGNSSASPLIGAYSGSTLPSSITSSATNGCLYFVFISNGSTTMTGWSSNVTCAPAESCPNPLGVSASTVVTTTSQLSWIEAGSATSWQVLILPCGSPEPTSTTTGWITTSSNPYTVTNLIPNCCNQYYVRSVCSESQTSEWTTAYQNLNGNYVVWNPADTATSLTGTFPGGTVTVTQTGAGNGIEFYSPALNDENLVVTGANTFSTFGPTTNPPSRSLTFTFSTPVIIDRYSMADVDLGGSWNDTFNFNGVTFTSTTATSMISTVTGAVATSDPSANGEYASWFGSTTPITSFSLDYQVTDALTHAYLAYALKVYIPCPIPEVDLTVSVNNPTICEGEEATVVATPSSSGTYNYVWTVPSGAINPGNVDSFTTSVAGVYSVIITDTASGEVSPSGSGTVTINTATTPTFDPITPICSGDTAPQLPLVSNEGVEGTWSPSVINNTASGDYIFTPNAGECASPLTISVIVNENVQPIFELPIILCSGSTAPILPTTSENGITGTWSPDTINTAISGSYIFTPDAGQCATLITRDIEIRELTVPTFTTPAPICTGNVPPTLPTTSLNGVTGTWSPSVVDNTQSATYTFIPDANQCATNSSLFVEVYQNCSFGSYASAVWLNNCAQNNFFNTVGSGSSIIGPIENNFQNTHLGTYVTNSSTFKLRGGEVKTFKTSTANVCSARLNYRIYLQSTAPGAFSVINLPFFEDCSGGSFPSGGPCNIGDQKWQEVLNDTESPIDLTAYPAGNYVLEIYYDVTGDVDSTSSCDDTILINNGGANFIATYTIQNEVGYFATDPSTCNSNDGSILITNLAPSTTYTLEYLDDEIPVSLTIISNTNGQYTINNLNVGEYNNIYVYANNCLIASGFAALTNSSTAPITSTNPLTCNSDTGTITISDLVPNETYSITYTDDTVLVGPITLTTNSSGQITITGLNAGVYTNFTLSTTYCNVTSSEIATLINPSAPIVTVTNSTICVGQNATVTANPEIAGSYNYVWTVPAGFTNPGNVASFTTSVAGTYTVVITPTGTSFCNNSFETPTATGAFPNMLNESLIPCWDTTASDGIFEYWPAAGFEGVFAYQGNQFIEINGNSVATVFQDFTTYPGADLHISFAHRGRRGTDVVRVEIGPIGGPYTSLGNFSDGNAAWVLHELDYRIPATGGNNYTIRFVSVSSTGGDPTVGNFLDAVSVTSTECSSAPTSGTVTILPTVTLSLSTTNNNQTICVDTAIENIVYTSTNATDVLVSGLPDGINGVFVAETGTFTISGTSTQSGIFNYTVTTVGGCNTETLNGTLEFTPTTPSTFNSITICSGDTVSFPISSLEGYQGTWIPETIDNTQTATYTFTPNSGQCANGGAFTVNVTQPTVPDFTQVGPFCAGLNIQVYPLLSTSINGVTGTWSPIFDNMTTTTYTFTPDVGQCATTASMTIIINTNVTPTFTAIAPLCIGEEAPLLPSVSNEGITGTWSPNVIDNTVSQTYLFTPDAGLCATTGNLSVTVQSGFDFEITGSCVDNDFILEINAVDNTFDTITASYIWYNNNGQSVGNNSNTFNVTQYLSSTDIVETLPITFSATVTTPDGCFKNESITLDRIYCDIQRGISVSSNPDQLNDFFDLELLDVKKLTIYNRYGLKLYSKDQYKNEWRGQADNGEILPDATYFYVIEFNNGSEPKTGWIYKISEK